MLQISVYVLRRAASGETPLKPYEPVFVPGGLLRLALYIALAVVTGIAYPYVYDAIDFLLFGWQAHGGG